MQGTRSLWFQESPFHHCNMHKENGEDMYASLNTSETRFEPRSIATQGESFTIEHRETRQKTGKGPKLQ
jgi:hypothetical protein